MASVLPVGGYGGFRRPYIHRIYPPIKRYRRVPSRSGYGESQSIAAEMKYARKKPRSKRKAIALRKWPTRPFPDVLRCTLSYHVKLHHTTNPRDDNVFSGNSIFRCDVTGAAGQPMLRDQLDAIYTNYRVLSSSICVEIVNSATEGAIVGVLPHPDATAVTTSKQFIEQDRTKYLVIGSDNAHDATGITHYASSKMMFPEVGDKTFDLQAGMAGNPTMEWYWHVFSEDITNAAAQDLYLLVTIAYNTILYVKDMWPVS